VFLNYSTCFGRHTAHHQELKNCNCSLLFYIRLWLPAAVMAEWSPLTHDSCRQPQTYVKPEAAVTDFELLMMGCNYSFLCSWWWAVCRSKHTTQPWQLPATTNVCKTRGCNYSFWAPDDERCVDRNIPLSHDSCRQPQTYVKPEAAITVFELLMMSGVSIETYHSAMTAAGNHKRM